MNKKPIVAIVGRPNVGKSTFVNRLIGSRESIVDDMPGVTRDRLYFDIDWANRQFTIIDTGGIIPGMEDEIMLSIYTQVEIAAEQADVILFLVDGKDGLTATDEDIANLLRKGFKKPVFLVVNKIDTPEKNSLINEFYALGIGEPYPISAMHGTGDVGDLLDEIVKVLPEYREEEKIEKIKIAVVGKPNVGKSSLVNSLLGEDRVIVSDVSGTTRDTIDTELCVDGVNYTLVDTAGIRKKAKVEYGIEKFSVARSLKAIRNADVALLMIDALEGLTDQDKKISQIIVEDGKAFIIVVNKWDAVENKQTNSVSDFTKKIQKEAPFLNYVPLLFISAKTKQRLGKIFPAVQEAYEFTNKRIATNLLNKVILEALSLNPPPSQKGKRLRIYYSTQASVAPPTFILFVNNKDILTQSYEKYIENKLRESFGFFGTPIRIVIREKEEKK
ncbi:MAG: ribosome biogenesis GTPase Der [bacterium]